MLSIPRWGLWMMLIASMIGTYFLARQLEPGWYK